MSLVDIFASIYELGGILKLYSKDFGDHLRGWDGVSQDYVLTPWYSYIGLISISITVFFYALQYHIIDSPRFKDKKHWWIVFLVIFIINFFIAFGITYNSLQAGAYSSDLNLNVSDCIGFGFSNSIWSFILFLLLTSFKYPKAFSNNCRYTTFWEP